MNDKRYHWQCSICIYGGEKFSKLCLCSSRSFLVSIEIFSSNFSFLPRLCPALDVALTYAWKRERHELLIRLNMSKELRAFCVLIFLDVWNGLSRLECSSRRNNFFLVLSFIFYITCNTRIYWVCPYLCNTQKDLR